MIASTEGLFALSNVVCRTNNMIERPIEYSYTYSSDCESSVI